MPVDEKLAKRLREVLKGHKDLEEKRLFGGIGFLLKGNMAVGVNKNDLIVRIDPQYHDETLKRLYTRTFHLSGRPMKGWLLVEPRGVETDEELKEWVHVGIKYASTLPPK